MQHRVDDVAPVARAAVPHPVETPVFDDGVVIDGAPLPRLLELQDDAPRLGRVKLEVYPLYVVDQIVVDEKLAPRADVNNRTHRGYSPLAFQPGYCSSKSASVSLL